MGEMDDIVREFLIEASELLDQLDRDLVELESAPQDVEILARIFRAVHTIKGTCGFLGFSRLEAVTHHGETLLARLRDGEIATDPEIVTTLLGMIDVVRSILAGIEATGREPDGDDASLLGSIEEHLRRASGAGADAACGGTTATDEARAGGGSGETTAESEPTAPAGTATAAPPSEHAAPESKPPPPSATESGAPAPPAGGNAASGAIRVSVELLDRLMNLVGELVLARNQIVETADVRKTPRLAAAAQRLNAITGELQESVMKARMQPIGTLWSRLPRVVRDLARSLGKSVELVLEGRETELDKSLLEAIKDPLTHLVRNAVDHGIETPERRAQAGKPETGRLSLRAYHDGGLVQIEIADDGAGIDVDRVRRKAVERGLIAPDTARELDDGQVLGLLMLPGFSTAESVTNVSGRGVGMDVVRQNVERIGGQVEIDTEPGRGTTVRIKLPLTLAIVPAMIVRTAGQRYAVPQSDLLELVSLAEDQVKQTVETIDGVAVFRSRGRLLPLVSLAQTLGVGADAAPGSTPDESALHIVVVENEGHAFGPVVDTIEDTREIVVKPIDKFLQRLGLFSGATILGDGSVALILDVFGIAAAAGITRGDPRAHLLATSDARRCEAAPSVDLLLFRSQGGREMAVPLDRVARLEEFSSDRIERAGRELVVQYRDRILPLVPLTELLGEIAVPGGDTAGTSPDALHVLVCGDAERPVGLVVDRILDVVSEAIDVELVAGAAGVLGSAVVRGRVMDLLDVDAILADLAPRLAHAPEPSRVEVPA